MINLLPPQRLANIRIARGNTVLRRYIELLVMSLVLLLAALLVANYFLSVQQRNVQNIVDANQSKIAKLKPIQTQAEQLSATINTIAGLFTHDVKFSSMLVQIGALMPQGAVLTGLQVSTTDLKAPLVISAQVDNESKGAVLLNNIQSSDLFDKSEIKSISRDLDDEDDTASTSVLTPVTGTTESTTTSPTPVVPKTPSPYQFTVVINAYFKPASTEVVK